MMGGRNTKYRLTRSGPFVLGGRTYYAGNVLGRIKAIERDKLLDLGWIELVQPAPMRAPMPAPAASEEE
jgi:hypothetical protein